MQQESLFNKRFSVPTPDFHPHYAPHYEDGVVVLRMYEGASDEEKAEARKQAHHLALMHSGKNVARNTHRFRNRRPHGKVQSLHTGKGRPGAKG